MTILTSRSFPPDEAGEQLYHGRGRKGSENRRALPAVDRSQMWGCAKRLDADSAGSAAQAPSQQEPASVNTIRRLVLAANVASFVRIGCQARSNTAASEVGCVANGQ